MFHDDKLKKHLEEAYKNINEPEKDKDNDGVDDSTEPSHAEDNGGGGDGGGTGGASGDGGGTTGGTSTTSATSTTSTSDGGGESETSDSDSDSDSDNQTRGIGGYGYYGYPGNRNWCKHGRKKDGTCKTNESYDNNIDSTQELFEAWKIMEAGGTSARYDSTDSTANPDDTEDSLNEKKKKKSKTQPHELGYSGKDREGNKHMPPASQTHKNKKKDPKHRRRQEKKKGYDMNESRRKINKQLLESRKKLNRLSKIINETHLNDEIRNVWDAFDQLADKIAELEKAYESTYEKRPHPPM